MAQETQTGALCQPRGVGWGGRWEGVSKGKGHMYTYGWFMLRFDKKNSKILWSNYPLIKFFKKILSEKEGRIYGKNKGRNGRREEKKMTHTLLEMHKISFLYQIWSESLPRFKSSLSFKNVLLYTTSLICHYFAKQWVEALLLSITNYFYYSIVFTFSCTF